MRKLVPDTASIVYSNGCSDAQPHKRKREIYKGVNIKDVKAVAAKLGLVGRDLNQGSNILFTQYGVDLMRKDAHMGLYISFASYKNTDSRESIMEVWYAPEPCSQEEADSYFLQRTSIEARAGVHLA